VRLFDKAARPRVGMIMTSGAVLRQGLTGDHGGRPGGPARLPTEAADDGDQVRDCALRAYANM
jgi:hypothetical protein